MSEWMKNHWKLIAPFVLSIIILTLIFLDSIHLNSAERAELEKLFYSVKSLTRNEIGQLRKHLNKTHLRMARRYGLDDITDETRIQHHMKEKRLTPVPSTHYYYIAPLSYSYPTVTQATRNLLDKIGAQFHMDLQRERLPLYRFYLTSLTRTKKQQRELCRINKNASRASSHTYGVTFDIACSGFVYSTGIKVLDWYLCKIGRYVPRFLKQEIQILGDENWEKLAAVLGRTILKLQSEGYCVIIYERNKLVYHVTLASKPI
jgi:hypothetical protein